ncbi:MAG: error-prone DNA polymerase [Salibacteraceae bacterium]|jgi:error-prone DNA polymerase
MYLNNHTYYSLKYGTISPRELVDEMLRANVSHFALTDINNTSALLELLRLAKGHSLTISAGIDFRNGAQQKFIAIAKNNFGWLELNNYLSKNLYLKKEIGNTAPCFKNAYTIYPFGTIDYTNLKPHEYIGIRISNLNALRFSALKNHPEKLVVMQPVTFRTKRDFNAHRLLRAIDTNVLLSQLDKKEEADPDEVFYTEKELRILFQEYPKAITNTFRLLRSCAIDFEFGNDNGHNNLQHYTGNHELDFKLLKRLAFKGISYRFDSVNDAILDRITMELDIIQKKDFVSYFLVAWKITKYARSQDYFYVGRGSGANSIISYLLRITDVDPMELDLYFERFINLFRSSPPDFDIDFSWKEREDVTRYIFERFPNATLLAAYSTFKHKSVLRELGKVFGLPALEIDKLQRNPTQADEIGQIIVRYSSFIQGFPSHLTVHSAGIIISEKPIHYFTSTFMPPKGYPTTHFDMHIAEDIALYKFDILGQRGLAKIKDSLEIITRNNTSQDFDIHDIKTLKKDTKSNNLLRLGNAIGCFYIESPAMRMLLRKLQVSKYLDLVAASSVIRPGVAQSGMMREYIIRHRNPEKRKLAQEKSPTLYNLMPETYGVMVYQEDVIKVAHYFAGLSLAEADVLRRGMSGKYRSRDEFLQVKDKFFSNCDAKGNPPAHTLEIWTQIESFAGYAFAKGHSASYAVESYQCLYLKAHYPLAFMVATINNGGGFYSRQLYLHEARKHGGNVHLPCINQSDWVATLYDTDIFLGLGFINGLESKTITTVLNERAQLGFFTDFRDFVERVHISLDQLILLVRSDVFRFTKAHKKALLWEAHLLLNKSKKTVVLPSLFHTPAKSFELPTLWRNELEDAFDEMELFGFPVNTDPFDLAIEIPNYPFVARLFPMYVNKKVTLIGYMVHIKRVRAKNGKNMFFGTFIDTEGEWIDTIVFPPVAARYPFTGPGSYVLHGTVTEEFDYHSLEIIAQKRIPSKNAEDVASTRLKIGGALDE